MAAETDRLQPPTVLGASVVDADGALAAPPGAASPIAVFKMPAQPVVKLPVADPNEAIPLPVPMDPNSGEKPDAGGSYKPSGNGKFGPIDQYPQNPRCYVAGHYVPAPPTCPN